MTRYFRNFTFLTLFAAVFMLPLGVYGQRGGFIDKTRGGTQSPQPGPGSEQAPPQGPIDISARSLEYDKAADTYLAKGDVEIKEGTRVLTADYVRYHKTTEDVYAEGNVIFKEEGDTVSSDKMYLNLLTKTGTIEKGKIFIKDGNFNIVGAHIEKLGENEYEIRKGQFTSCEIEGPSKPAWKFSAEKTNVTVEGYAKTTGMKFYILDKPVFYIPAGFFPVKAERQSGFLMPEIITSSRDGVKFTQSYFWAISKDKDATFYSQFIQNRGVKVGSEFRYSLREDLKGAWDFFIISDKDYGGTRYELKGRHEQVIGKDLTFKTNIDYVSDKDVLVDFGLTPLIRSESLLKSNAYIEKPFERSLLTVEAAYFRNLTQRDNDTMFKYLPHATFFTEYIPILKNRFYTDFVSDFTTFYREKGDKFTRLAFEPRFRMPYSYKGMNFLLSATYYETAYLINRVTTESGSSTAERHTARIQADSNVQFIRNYNTSLFDIGTMQSVIKPNLRYTFIPASSFSNVPSVDPYDRIAQQNTITYSVGHYLYAVTPKNARELSVFEISQTYGLSGNLETSTDYKGSGNRLSDMSAKLTLFPVKNFTYITQAAWNASGNGLTTMYNTFSYKVPKEYFVNLYHAYSRDLNNEVSFDTGVAYKLFDFRYHVR
ncbi:MAG TPA: LPS assembly protein LptD, partial [Syntrophorhabdaceae bacterium]